MLKKLRRTYVVTGAAGFIGSNLVRRLLSNGHNVIGIDNLSTGRLKFLEDIEGKQNFRLEHCDIKDLENLSKIFYGCDVVYHLAANADVRDGLLHPRKDLDENTIGTFNVLEAMRLNKIQKIFFASTGSVYGDAKQIPTPENSDFPIQTSLYGASKLAGEALIAAYCEGYSMKGVIFRFVGILGENYTHGHVYDFIKKLKNNSETLQILGDGSQKKSYLYVQDCIDAMLLAEDKCVDKFNIFNLGTDGFVTVLDSVQFICDSLGVSPKLSFTGGKQGWIGDNPFIYLDTQKIRTLGWEPKNTIEMALEKTIKFLIENEWVLSLDEK